MRRNLPARLIIPILSILIFLTANAPTAVFATSTALQAEEQSGGAGFILALLALILILLAVIAVIGAVSLGIIGIGYQSIQNDE
jgi:hypothetical protein